MSDLQNTLVNKIREQVKKATANVATKVEAEKGDFKVIISSDSIDSFYKGVSAGKVKVASLSQEEIDYINDNPQAFAQDALEAFMTTDPKTLAEVENARVKTAANSAVTSETPTITTEKQLAEHNVDLHPRTDEYPNKVTQKQLPDAGQRPGTYDLTTEAQLRDERKTFYGDTRSADWQSENRTSVTEKQLDESPSKFSDYATTERGEMGSKFDGGVEKQNIMTGEKQLQELLKHHSYTTPNTVTEDQLKGQKGELGRVTAEAAIQIIKEATEAMGKTVLAAGATPATVINIVKKLTSHASKMLPLANVLNSYKGSDTSAIDSRIEKSRYFGKVANAAQTWSENLIADIFVRQLSKSASHPLHVVEGLIALAETSDLTDRINASVESILVNKPSEIKQASENVSVFKQVLANKPEVIGDDNDGLYEYNGSVKEIKASASNKEEFVKAASEYAEAQIKKIANKPNLILEASKINVDEEKGVFSIQFKDPSKNTLEVRAEKRRSLVKEAQTPTGGMQPPSAGPPAANPAVPPTGGDMGAPPPTEALSQPPVPPEDEDTGSEGEPKPPGSFCPACGSEDVDIDSGDSNCNKCGTKWHTKWTLEITKVPGVMPEQVGEKKEEAGTSLEGLGSSGEQTPLAEGSGTTLPNMPVAASIKLTPMLLNKLAEMKLEIGNICPNCSSKDTDVINKEASKEGLCWSCQNEYQVEYKEEDNQKVAEVKWVYKTASECTDCNRVKKAFVKSLNDYGMEFNAFEKLDTKAQADVVLKMAKAGTLNLKEAMNEELPLQKFAATSRWNGYEKFDKFPKASCMERIARRYGENATSMSGPCRGKNLAECVCGQLENLGVYTDGLAAKVASRQVSTNPMINNPSKTCIAMFVRDGFDIEESCTICEGLRAAHASSTDLIVEAVCNCPCSQETAKPMPEEPDFGDDEAPVGDMSAVDTPETDVPVDTSPVEEGLPADLPGGDLVETTPMETSEEVPAVEVGMEAEVGGSDMAEAVDMVIDGLQEIVNNLKESKDGVSPESLPGETPEWHDESVETPEEEAAESPEVQEEEAETGVEKHDIPGIPDDLKEDEPLEKEGEPEESEETEEPKEENPFEKKEEKEVSALDKMLMGMKTGTNKRSADALDSLFEGLMRQAQKKNDDVVKVEYKNPKEKKIFKKPAQDSTEVKFQDKGTLGSEEKFEKGVVTKVDVPRGKATLGEEGAENTLNDKGDVPSIITGDAKLEGETNESEKTDQVDGNQAGMKS